MKETIMKFLMYTGIVIAFLLLAAVIVSYPTMWLWNWLMPVIFGLPEITVWQALGLNLLAGILIKPTASLNKKDK